MSHFFKYRTRDAVRADVAARGHSIRFADELGALARPLRVEGRTVGNRLAIHPMEGCDATSEGGPSDLTLRRFARFGAGGAKVVWGEAAAVVPEGRANPAQLVCRPENASGFAQIADVCRRAHRAAWGRDDDLLVGLQLTHSGRYSCARPVLAARDPLLDPRTVVDKTTGARADVAPLLADDDLERLLDRYVEAAGIAFQAGFDFVDLKQCHRYLLNELLAARARPGRFGGDFEGRTRFIRTLVARLRDEYPGGLIATRLNVYDGVPFVPGPDGVGVPAAYPAGIDADVAARSVWGARDDDPLATDLAEPVALVRALSALGVSMFNLSMGNPYACPHVLRPFDYAPVDGYRPPEHPLVGVDRHLRLTAEVQAALPDAVVIGSGYSWLQAFALDAAAATIEDRRATCVGLGRAALADPAFARAVLLGTPPDPKRTCRTFSYCTALMRAKHNDRGQFPAGCPPFDKEVYGPIWNDARAAEKADAERA